jgi:hypothetical protein
MATAVADPSAPDAAPPPEPDGPGAPGSHPASAESPQRECANCGARLVPGQDWCLACGTPAPGALTTRSPGWRSAALILGTTAVLVLGAAAAAYAALTQPSTPGQVTQTVAQAPAPPAATAPTTTTPPPATPPATATTPAPAKALPLPASKPPQIPLTATKALPTPKTTGTTKAPPAAAKPPSEAKPPQPAILLDTNAASTYNPSHLPESSFGDPSLAIDGETATGWTAQVQPATAPNMAAGLLIDLKDTQRLAAAEVITATPGLTAQVFGTSASTAPASITSPEWTALTKAEVIKNRHERIPLGHSSSGFRFVVLWISRVPASAVGTSQAPGRVSINELELFAATK